MLRRKGVQEGIQGSADKVIKMFTNISVVSEQQPIDI